MMLARAACACAIAAAALLAQSAQAAPPAPASGVFVTRNYALTLRAPRGLTYCRLPDEWTGSDHGTILFLVPPTDCGGAGYPSSSRGFTPADTPRLELYYGRTDSDVPPRHRCRGTAMVRFMDRPTRPCPPDPAFNQAGAELATRYTADSEAEAILTLLTTRRRFRHDLETLRALAATTHACSVPWQDKDGRTRLMGSGPRCPRHGDFY